MISSTFSRSLSRPLYPCPFPRRSNLLKQLLSGTRPLEFHCRREPFPCQGIIEACLPPLLALVIGAKAWAGRGGGAAIRESTGRDFDFAQRNQRFFRKGRRKASGLRPAPWKDHCLVVSRSATLPPR